MAGKKILVADDSLTIQKVIKLALLNEGYEIQTVSDGGDTLQQIEAFKPDLILIDVSLPTKNAFDIKDQTDQQGNSFLPRFVLMSSAFEQVDEDRIKQAGFHGRLVKPFDPAHLRQVLTETLSSPSNLGAGVKSKSEKTLTGIISPPKAPALTPPSAPALPTTSTPPPIPDSDAPLEEFAPISLQFNMEDETSSHSNELPDFPRAKTEETDIRNLTESTIKMSGLDDFQWSVNEGPKKHLFSADSQSERDFTPDPLSDLDAHSDLLTPLESISDDGGSNFPLDRGALKSRETEKSQQTGSPGIYSVSDQLASMANSPLPPPPPAMNSVLQVSKKEIEDVIRKQIEETLRETTRKILPEIAERLIKQEIHKLLMEQP